VEGFSIVVISLLKVCLQTTRIPLSHSDTVVCSILCASDYTYHYLLKHRMMLADVSMFFAVMCAGFATSSDASRLAAARSNNAVCHAVSCDDAHCVLLFACCLELR